MKSKVFNEEIMMGIILIIEKTFEEIGEALIEGISTDKILENREMKEENREIGRASRREIVLGSWCWGGGGGGE